MIIIAIYFLLFIFYSIIGWIIEIINAYLHSKKFVNRGFLFGPWYPIYGLGGLFITILAPNNIILTFILSFIICGIIEYLTSYILEKLFHARWWDYSNDNLNIKGRVCIRNLIIFGICGLTVKFILSPLYFNIIDKITNRTIISVAIIIFSIYILDTIISIKIISKIAKNNSFLQQDNTIEIRNKVKKTIALFHK